MSNYPPPNTGYYPPQPQQQPYYGAQPQPQYVPLQQQTQWGLQPAPQQQQQNYYAPQGQPMPPPTYDGSVNPDSGLPTKFNPKPKYNDLWAAILFAVQLAGFVVLSYFAISNALKTGSGPGGARGIGSLFSTGGLITLCISVGVGAIFSVAYFFLTVAFPTFVIKVKCTIHALWMGCVRLVSLGCLLCTILLLCVFCFSTLSCSWRRVPFCTQAVFLFLKRPDRLSNLPTKFNTGYSLSHCK